MRKKSWLTVLILVFAVTALTGAACWLDASGASGQATAQQKREELYRLNNLGVALMEQYKHEDAVKQFKLALERDANFAIARVNLAMAQFFLSDVKSAVAEAQAALKLAPTSLHAQYVLGAAYKNDRLYDEALAAFNKVLAVDAKDPYTNIQIGQIYSSKAAIHASRRSLSPRDGSRALQRDSRLQSGSGFDSRGQSNRRTKVVGAVSKA
jgi:tetratricopeptide (TPR) repeat protein